MKKIYMHLNSEYNEIGITRAENLEENEISRIENYFGIKVGPKIILIQIELWDGQRDSYSEDFCKLADLFGIKLDIPEIDRILKRDSTCYEVFGPSFVPLKLIRNLKDGDTLKFKTTFGPEFEVVAEGRMINISFEEDLEATIETYKWWYSR